MDSVYEAARKHADGLKAELAQLQTYLDLHDHYRAHFGLTTPSAPADAEVEAPPEEVAAPDAAASEATLAEAVHAEGAPVDAAPSEADATLVEQAAATHEIHVQESSEETAVEGEADAAPQAATETAPEDAAEAPHEREPEALTAHAEPDAPLPTTTEDAPRVIRASEGVLVATSPDAHGDAPLSQEATLQSVAEKLAATIGATHPTVTGYTV